MAAQVTLLSASSLMLFSICTLNLASCIEFSLDPNSNLRADFYTQSLKPSKYPFASAEGNIFLTQDPTDGGENSPRYNVGRLTYNKPIRFKDDAHQLFSFQTSFVFNITAMTKYNESGDGIAFVITTDKEPPQNSTGRFLGLMPESQAARHERFMAVEFDTFQNLQAEIQDPSASHIGLDISSLKSLQPIHDTADPTNPLYLYNNYTITAWVSYNASSLLIQVWAINSSNTQRPEVPILSIPCNLSQVFENFTDIYVGIIAASGNNSQASILYAWNFTIMNDVNDKGAPLKLLLSTLIPGSVLIFFAVLIAGAYRVAPLTQMRHKSTIKMASASVHQYDYGELKRATKGFSEGQRLGTGGSGSVYKGVLQNGRIVAVKRMRDGLVEPQSIAREVEIIGELRHRHLLQLQGWCYERGEALLVYEYMAKGSLEGYLYGDKRRGAGQLLGSEVRFNILLGVAAALEYLHTYTGQGGRVIHRDVKAANVLLTDTMEAKLGDFGLARLVTDDVANMTMTAAGTLGYYAPEVPTRRVTEKVDVYSFGVLALEVACGHKALNFVYVQDGLTIVHLVPWVWQHHQRTTILDALDPGLMAADDATDEELQQWRCILHLALICCQADPDARPCIGDVHQKLKESTVLPLPDHMPLYPPSPAGISHLPTQF